MKQKLLLALCVIGMMASAQNNTMELSATDYCSNSGNSYTMQIASDVSSGYTLYAAVDSGIQVDSVVWDMTPAGIMTEATDCPVIADKNVWCKTVMIMQAVEYSVEAVAYLHDGTTMQEQIVLHGIYPEGCMNDTVVITGSFCRMVNDTIVIDANAESIAINADQYTAKTVDSIGVNLNAAVTSFVSLFNEQYHSYTAQLEVEFDNAAQTYDVVTFVMYYDDQTTETYTYTLMFLDGCYGLGIEENEEANVSYPNPTTGIFHIETGFEGTAEVAVYDTEGRRVLSRTTEGNTVEIDLGNLPAGLYYYTVANGDRRLSGKVMKK